MSLLKAVGKQDKQFRGHFKGSTVEMPKQPAVSLEGVQYWAGGSWLDVRELGKTVAGDTGFGSVGLRGKACFRELFSFPEN